MSIDLTDRFEVDMAFVDIIRDRMIYGSPLTESHLQIMCAISRRYNNDSIRRLYQLSLEYFGNQTHSDTQPVPDDDRDISGLERVMLDLRRMYRQSLMVYLGALELSTQVIEEHILRMSGEQGIRQYDIEESGEIGDCDICYSERIVLAHYRCHPIHKACRQCLISWNERDYRCYLCRVNLNETDSV